MVGVVTEAMGWMGICGLIPGRSKTFLYSPGFPEHH
jgi:hypothetical protein